MMIYPITPPPGSPAGIADAHQPRQARCRAGRRLPKQRRQARKRRMILMSQVAQQFLNETIKQT